MIVAAADGSSLANPGPSGWAWYIDQEHWAAGGWAKGTNNMGELMSVLDLLRATKNATEPLRVLCDSQYTINCCTRWIPAWKKRGWRKSDNKPVMNLDLLKQLDEELAGRSVTFQWVKGHAGHPLNEQADTLARAAATAYRDGTPVVTGPGFTSHPVAAPELFDEAERADRTRGGAGDDAPVSDVEEPVTSGHGRRDVVKPSADGPSSIPPAGSKRSVSSSSESGRFSRPTVGPGRSPSSSSADGSTGGALSGNHPTAESSRDDAPLKPEPPEPLQQAQPDLFSVPYTVRKPAHDDEEDALVADLTALTRELMSDQTQLDRERLLELMHPEYVSHQPDGLIRTRGSILARPATLAGSIQMDVLGADRLGDPYLLLRYKLKRNSQDFLCAALWQKVGATWQIRFQQFTPVIA